LHIQGVPFLPQAMPRIGHKAGLSLMPGVKQAFQTQIFKIFHSP